MTIGEDIQILLGLVPTRDRAGIQRGTMATEAARAAAADGNAEGQALTRQGFDFARAAPPPVQIPPGMGAEPDAANMPIANGAPAQFVIPGSTGGTSAAPTPAPRERVVAASPAAAPSPAVMRNSDIMLAALKQQQQQARTQQLFSSIGLIANGLFNRNPESANATRQSLAEGLGGGGGRGGVGDLKTLQTLLEMRQGEDDRATALARREEAIDTLQRQFKMDRPGATLLYDSEAFKDRMKSENLGKEADRRRVGQTAKDLEPHLPDIAKRLGQPLAIVREWNDEGTLLAKLDPKERAEVEAKLATAGKTVAETIKLGDESRRGLEEEGYRKDVLKNPAAYTSFYKGVEPQQLREYAKTEAGWKKFLEGQAPSLDAKQQQYWTTYVPQETGAGREPKSFDEWSKAQARAGGPSPDDISLNRGVEAVMKTVDTRNVEAQQIKSNLANRQVIQDAWEKVISGGYGVDKQLMLRSTAARILGKPDIDVDKTQAFFGIMNTEIAAAARMLPGPLSEKELQFIKDMKGGKELTPEGIRALHILLDKADRIKIATYNKWWAEQQAHPTRGKLKGMELYGPVDMPPPGRFLREELEDNPEFVQKLRANPTPETRQSFDKRFGAGVADQILAQPE